MNEEYAWNVASLSELEAVGQLDVKRGSLGRMTYQNAVVVILSGTSVQCTQRGGICDGMSDTHALW